MARKKRTTKPKVSALDPSKDLWINPRFNLRGKDGNRAWGTGNLSPESGARFLELADLALGHKKPSPGPVKKKNPASSGPGAHHVTHADEGSA